MTDMSAAGSAPAVVDVLKDLGFVERCLCVPRCSMLTQITDKFEISVCAAGDMRMPDTSDARFDVSFLSHASDAYAPERRENLDAVATLALVKSLIAVAGDAEEKTSRLTKPGAAGPVERPPVPNG